MIRFIAFIFILLVTFSCQEKRALGLVSNAKEAEEKLINYDKKLSQLPANMKITSLEIFKSRYRLYAYHKNLVVKSYPVVFGFNPVDDKLMEGDGCTPEGEFKIKTKYPHKKWSKFIWLDYPNAQSQKKHAEAKKAKLIPAKATIGGSVGIHGVPYMTDISISQRVNWTLGCISLKNKDIDELYQNVDNNTMVKIYK